MNVVLILISFATRKQKNVAAPVLRRKTGIIAFAIWNALLYFAKIACALQILQDVKKKEKPAVEAIVVQGLSAKMENAKNLRFPAAGRKKIAAEGIAILKKRNTFAGPEDAREANVLEDR